MHEIMKIAIMQPYFWSQVGYYRLFAGSDLMVYYDDAQYMKEGWINRNKLTLFNGKKDWFTLPLKKAPLEVRIRDLEWAGDAARLLERQVRRFPVLSGMKFNLSVSPYEFIVRSNMLDCYSLKIPFHTIEASRLGVDPALRGQARVLAMCKKLGATEYINTNGGRALYDEAAFAQEGIKLSFLPGVVNMGASIERIAQDGVDNVRKEIYKRIAE
jgi:hypothetical protein